MWNLWLLCLPLCAATSKVVCGFVWVATRTAMTSPSVIWEKCEEDSVKAPPLRRRLSVISPGSSSAGTFSSAGVVSLNVWFWVARRVVGPPSEISSVILFLKPTTAHLRPHIETTRLCATSGSFCGRWNDCLPLFAFPFFSHSRKHGSCGFALVPLFRTCRPELEQVFLLVKKKC